MNVDKEEKEGHGSSPGEEKKEMPLRSDREPSEHGISEAMRKEWFQEGHCDWLC